MPADVRNVVAVAGVLAKMRRESHHLVEALAVLDLRRSLRRKYTYAVSEAHSRKYYRERYKTTFCAV